MVKGKSVYDEVEKEVGVRLWFIGFGKDFQYKVWLMNCIDMICLIVV